MCHKKTQASQKGKGKGKGKCGLGVHTWGEKHAPGFYI